MNKNSQQIRNRRELPTAGIILSGETLETFSLKSRARQGGPPFLFLVNIGLKVLVRAITQGKGTRV